MRSEFEKVMDRKMHEVVEVHNQLRELVLKNSPIDEMEERLKLEERYFDLALKGVIKEMEAWKNENV